MLYVSVYGNDGFSACFHFISKRSPFKTVYHAKRQYFHGSCSHDLSCGHTHESLAKHSCIQFSRLSFCDHQKQAFCKSQRNPVRFSDPLYFHHPVDHVHKAAFRIRCYDRFYHGRDHVSARLPFRYFIEYEA